MGAIIDYLKMCWNQGAQQGKELKEEHSDKVKKIVKRKGDK